MDIRQQINYYQLNILFNFGKKMKKIAQFWLQLFAHHLAVKIWTVPSVNRLPLFQYFKQVMLERIIKLHSKQGCGQMTHITQIAM